MIRCILSILRISKQKHLYYAYQTKRHTVLEARLNSIYEFCPYRKGNITRLHYNDQLENAV